MAQQANVDFLKIVLKHAWHLAHLRSERNQNSNNYAICQIVNAILPDQCGTPEGYSIAELYRGYGRQTLEATMAQPVSENDSPGDLLYPR